MRRLYLAAFFLALGLGAGTASAAARFACMADYHNAWIDDNIAARRFTSHVWVACGAGTGSCTWTEHVTVLKSRGAVGGWAVVSHTDTPRTGTCGGYASYMNDKNFAVGGTGTYKCILEVTDANGAQMFYDELVDTF